MVEPVVMDLVVVEAQEATLSTLREPIKAKESMGDATKLALTEKEAPISTTGTKVVTAEVFLSGQSALEVMVAAKKVETGRNV